MPLGHPEPTRASRPVSFGPPIDGGSKRSVGRLRPWLALVLPALVALVSLAAPVEAQVRPRILIAFDTSGSMGLDFNGVPTFGDGVLTGCATRAGAGQCGTNCTAGLDTNCDGLVNDSRIYIAKNAVADVIRAYGEVDWGLERFMQTQAAGATCPTVQNFECNTAGPYVTSYGNPLCNSGGNCALAWANLFPAACRPGTGGLGSIRNRIAADPSVCINYAGTCGLADGNGGDVLVGFPDLGPWAGRDNSYGILRWLDGQETNFLNVTTAGDYCTHTGAGDCELRPEGGTPLAGILTSALNYIDPIRDADTVRACRPYSVLLITDGNESCGGNPSTVAATLLANGINTYVVGLAIDAASRTALNAIATAGGTDAGATGGDTAYFANDRVTLSAGLAEIVRRSIRYETCNSADDDCDTRIDEGVTNACGTCGTVPTETCNGTDDDCDGTVDDGVSNACGTCGTLSETCNGRDDNCNGAIDEGGVCTCPAPSSEICDNVDNDCDTRIDEGPITRPCGVDTGECAVGTETCTAGVFTGCTAVGATTETCNNRDDNCDGVVDGITRSCGSTVGACRAGTETCTTGAWGSCLGSVGASTEICDGIDNDCDGTVDDGDPGGGGACGSGIGVCRPGVVHCVGGALTCVGGTSAGTEVCNALDDDCDGTVDDGIATMGSCGSTTGECRAGVMACVSGSFTCVGARGPQTETCNALDDDCNGAVDDALSGIGVACGTDTGVCTPGITACVSGSLVCTGASSPGTESCNALDDDCDGAIDESLGVGEACGTDTGECVPGFNYCEDGVVVCRGALGATDETCDALDNDCDGNVDEGLGLGEACGTDEGICMAGRQMCIDGRAVCVGGVGSAPEACDCEDNDCDGATDEPPAEGSLCPSGSTCVECDCAPPCIAGEFGDECATGRTPVRSGDTCYCVAERCNATTCAGQTIEQDGDVLCAPDADGVPTCICRSNECVFPCSGVVCADGTVCDPTDPDGRCVEDSCRALGCPDGEVCDFGTGACTADPCATAGCRADQACRDGVCEASCATVTCGDGERCVAGSCEPDLCADATCTGDRVCDPATGDCVTTMCADVACGAGTSCDPLTGECVPSPCLGLTCPSGQRCVEGECALESEPDGGVTEVDAGVDAGDQEEGDGHTRALATGGGCICATGAPSTHTGSSSLALVASGLVLALAALRRRRVASAKGSLVAKASVGVVALVAASTTSGCAVDPFCFDCVDETVDAGTVDASSRDAMIVTPDVNLYDAGPDAYQPDGCVVGADELCNAHDDDCDGNVDEGIDTDTDEDNCGGCGLVCAPAGAFGECVAGSCTIRECDVGRFDRNGDVTDGCEVRCLPTATDDTLCDLRDNDCDFAVDEDVDLTTDPANCGVCGRTCRFAHATASCEASACALGACEVGFYDVDGVLANGCEYACTPADPAVESCNGRDDDCDGSIDEGNPEGGASCGSTAGACRAGTETCVAGHLTCVGGVSPSAETCNAVDDDCNGSVDDGNPGGGASCGSDVGTCRTGVLTCTSGAISCVGSVGSTAETCNGLDDDCDGSIDDGNPGGGGTCGVDTGACSFGTVSCTGGTLVCSGAVGPVAETCNGVDDNCNGSSDETYSLTTDINNCGMCGRVCSFAHATPVCSSGTCAIAACDSGWVNRDGSAANGCEYNCTVRGAEVCNGVDDNCDGTIDNGLTAPSNFCNPNGVCAGTTAVCSGTSGWTCTYASPYYQASETLCDSRDNDCDGQIDEPFSGINPVTGVGTACTVGVGACRRTGSYYCATSTSVACSAGAAGSPVAETCNNIDDNCDGLVDNGILPSAIPTVSIPRTGGGTVQVMTYEASRPDATSSSAGTNSALACSNANVVPWTDVTWTQARSACCALNASGTCSGDGSGWRLCDATDWTAACRGTAGTCSWSYSSACTTSATLTCNGEEYDSSASTGDQDALAATGSASFSSCYANWGGSSRIYDMSGNAREWTNTETSTGSGTYYLRGGSYNNIEPGRACTFDFTVAASTFSFPNTGFRCCYY